MSDRIMPAAAADAEAVRDLAQRAYRGDSARAGWTHESDLLEGERISRAEVEALIAHPAERLLLCRREGTLVGCVRVADLGGGLAYLGLLAVEPGLQAAGVGRALIAAAEALAQAEFAATAIELTVIDTRLELIRYYERRGYIAGEARPFPLSVDPPLTMVAMTKALA